MEAGGQARRGDADRPRAGRAGRQFRRDTLFIGARLNPINSTQDTSSSGAPNVAFIEMLPFISNQLIQCLRAEYAPLPTTTFASLPLVVKATAVGVSDSGDTFRANPIAYTLNLRHTCGNGRTDDGESCDASAPGNACAGTCSGTPSAPGKCSQNASVGCTSDADCLGFCLPPGSTAGLALDGTVMTDIVASPSPLYLGKLRRGDAAEREIRVTSGRPGAAYEVTAVEHTNPALGTRLERLPDGSGQRIVVTLEPHMPPGRFNDQLVPPT